MLRGWVAVSKDRSVLRSAGRETHLIQLWDVLVSFVCITFIPRFTHKSTVHPRSRNTPIGGTKICAKGGKCQ